MKTSNEIIYDVLQRTQVTFIDDVVTVTFYARHKIDSKMICRHYNVDTIGEYLLETCKVYSYEYAYKESHGVKYCDIVILLDM